MENQTPIATQPPLPPSEAVSPIPEKPTNSRAWEKWVIILLLIAALSCGIIVYLLSSQQNSKASPVPVTQSVSPTPDPTAQWKTYTDIYYGGLFSIKYPPTWKANPDNLNKYIFFESPDYKSNLGEGLIMVISVSNTNIGTNKEIIDIEQWFSEFNAPSEEPASVRIDADSVKRIKVAGVPAIQYDQMFQTGETVTKLIKNNKLFTISRQWPNANLLENKKVMDAQVKSYNQILSTIKFADPTKNWKTYNNSTYKYQFKYPQTIKVEESTAKQLEKNELQKVSVGFCNASVRKTEGYKTIAEWAKKYKIVSASGSSLVKNTTEATLGGLPAKQFSIFLFDHDDTAIATLSKNNIYYFSYSNTLHNENYSNEDQESELTCRQILSTFQLTK